MSVAVSPSRVLDFRGLPGPEPPAAVVAAFDALERGATLLLVMDHAPTGLLLGLQRERAGRFEWSPLEEGPPTWRVEIARRTSGEGPRGIMESLAWDHDRLEELDKTAFGLRAAGQYAQAAVTWHEFAHGLRRHIGFEEDLLFPEFERRSGMPSDAGPTAVMRAEHREIESLVAEIERGMAEPSSAVERTREALHRVLVDHNVKEERVLYPASDTLMTEGERDELVRRIQAYRR